MDPHPLLARRQSLRQPVLDLASIQRFALEVRQRHGGGALEGSSGKRQCVSQGIAALVPDEVQPDDVVYGDNDLAKCEAVLLLRGGSEYGPLSARARAQEFKPVAARHNATLWER